MLLRNPVTLNFTGNTYTKEAIQEWLKHHDTDPLSGVKLNGIYNYTPNRALADMLEAEKQRLSEVL